MTIERRVWIAESVCISGSQKAWAMYIQDMKLKLATSRGAQYDAGEYDALAWIQQARTFLEGDEAFKTVKETI